VAPMF